MFFLSDYDFFLPKEKIAQTPCKKRSNAKLLKLNKQTKAISHYRFKDITNLLREDDLLVINDTKVVPARILGTKENKKIEVFIIDYTKGIQHLVNKGFFQCDCIIKPSKSIQINDVIFFDNKAYAKVLDKKDNIYTLKFFCSQSFNKFLEKHGQTPLPPYIKRNNLKNSCEGSSQKTIGEQNIILNDKQDYQTVYAAKDGAVAAPTAGLHFTKELIDKLKNKLAIITLHTGYGTFMPIRVDDIRKHKIHREYFSLTKENAYKINQAKKENRRIIAVGTTSVRTLEFISDTKGMVKEQKGYCDLFIYPGYKFKCIDAMITNFHLPKSTLLMLVSAFYDRENILKAYKLAIENDYRFFSYGDAMLIE